MRKVRNSGTVQVDLCFYGWVVANDKNDLDVANQWAVFEMNRPERSLMTGTPVFIKSTAYISTRTDDDGSDNKSVSLSFEQIFNPDMMARYGGRVCQSAVERRHRFDLHSSRSVIVTVPDSLVLLRTKNNECGMAYLMKKDGSTIELPWGCESVEVLWETHGRPAEWESKTSFIF